MVGEARQGELEEEGEEEEQAAHPTQRPPSSAAAPPHPQPYIAAPEAQPAARSQIRTSLPGTWYEMR